MVNFRPRAAPSARFSQMPFPAPGAAGAVREDSLETSWLPSMHWPLGHNLNLTAQPIGTHIHGNGGVECCVEIIN